MRTFVATDSSTHAHGLLIEVFPEVDEVEESLRAAFRRRLFDQNVRVGLMFARHQTLVVRDMVSDMEFSRNEFNTSDLDTSRLFSAARVGAPAAGDAFVSQVIRWLGETAASWQSTLPDDAFAVMVPDVVGHLVDASFEPLDAAAAAE
jgi:hypothetical protein